MKFRSLNAAVAGLVLSASCLVNVASAGIIWDFEGGTLGDQTGSNSFSIVDTNGTAFDYFTDGTLSNPVRYDAINDQGSITNTPGGGANDWLIRSDWARNTNGSHTKYGDAPKGTLRSDIFTMGANSSITFDIGGTGFHNLNGLFLIDALTNSVLFDSTSFGYGYLRTGNMNTSSLAAGTNVYFEIRDHDSGGWGHVTVDNIVVTNGILGSTPAAITSVPEPSTLAIFALGIFGLASRRFKKQS